MTPEVELFSWDPARPVVKGRIGRLLPIRRRVGNFGDLLGPLIVRALLDRAGIDPATARRDVQLLSVGSVIHLARPGAVIWGSGVNGKMSHPDLPARLDVRAVRGPLTQEWLARRGVPARTAVHGDPALLVGQLFPELVGLPRDGGVTVVPNLNDVADYRGVAILDPRQDVWSCLTTIARSELVVGSSLHALVVAEALGVPARAVRSRHEARFKYEDYYLGTGRSDYRIAATAEEARRLGGEPAPAFSARSLVAAFPFDLWAASPVLDESFELRINGRPDPSSDPS